MNEEQIRVLRELRDQGFVVIVWTPDEVGNADPVRLEDRCIELGWEVISDLKQEEEEEDELHLPELR